MTGYQPNLIEIILVVATIGLIPLAVVTLTGFMKISVVLFLIRNALGVQQTPPNLVLYGRSEERRVGKECRSLCDWSSDVCSSDLGCGHAHRVHEDFGGAVPDPQRPWGAADTAQPGAVRQIGRASCRERV